jgi:hypothetical protein
MKIFCKIYIFVLLLFLICCKNSSKGNEKINIYLDIRFSDELKVNNKTVLSDLTDDIEKYDLMRFYQKDTSDDEKKNVKSDNTSDIKTGNKISNSKSKITDSTTDIIKNILKNIDTSEYIFEEDVIREIEASKSEFTEFLKKDLPGAFNNDSNVNISDYKDDLSGDAFVLSLYITDYAKGEYNLLKDVPAKFRITISLDKKDSKIKYLYIIKDFNQISDIENPIEKMRIKIISKNISDYIYKIYTKTNFSLK